MKFFFDAFSLIQVLEEKGGELMKDFFSFLKFLFVLVFVIAFILAVLIMVFLVDKNII